MMNCVVYDNDNEVTRSKAHNVEQEAHLSRSREFRFETFDLKAPNAGFILKRLLFQKEHVLKLFS